jgi:hypothetical protein
MLTHPACAFDVRDESLPTQKPQPCPSNVCHQASSKINVHLKKTHRRRLSSLNLAESLWESRYCALLEMRFSHVERTDESRYRSGEVVSLGQRMHVVFVESTYAFAVGTGPHAPGCLLTFTG